MTLHLGRVWRYAMFSAVLAGCLVALVVQPALAGAAGTGGTKVTVQGTLQLVHADDFAGRRAHTYAYFVRTEHGRIQLAFDGAAPDQSMAGATVRVSGTLSKGIVHVGGSSGGGMQTVSSATVAAGPQSKNVLVIQFNFSNDRSTPWTQAFATGVVFTNASSVAAYYNEESYGQLTMTGSVTPWLQISNDNSGCAYGAWASAANSAATAAGISLSGYTQYVYAFPRAASCGWAGLAYLPGTQNWANGEMDLRVVGHELGHNFGVHHANSMNCTSSGARVWLSAPANCTSTEYGDPFDIMGSSSWRHENNYHLAQLGFFGAADKQDVTTTGTYQLGVADISSTTPKLLRLARAGTGTWFYLEFRQPYGSYFDNFGSSDPAVTGVSIRLGYDYSNLSQSQLLDTTSGTSSFSDASLGAGRSVTDPTANVTFTTVSVSSTGATVQISFGPDTQNPTMPGNLRATATSATSVSLTWTASTDNVGVAGYRVYRDGGSTPITTTSSTSYTDSGVSAQTLYSYKVEAYDAANNVSDPATTSVTTPAVDVQPPSAPGNLTYTTKAGRVTLKWGAATDNLAIGGYKVYRNGTLRATLTGASTLTYTDRPPRGTVSYYVVAYDTSNLVGPASNTVTLVAR
jgi:chitodextrinase